MIALLKIVVLSLLFVPIPFGPVMQVVSTPSRFPEPKPIIRPRIPDEQQGWGCVTILSGCTLLTICEDGRTLCDYSNCSGNEAPECPS